MRCVHTHRDTASALMKMLLEVFRNDHLAVPGGHLSSADALDGTMDLESSADIGADDGTGGGAGGSTDSDSWCSAESGTATSSPGSPAVSTADRALLQIDMDDLLGSPVMSHQAERAAARASNAAERAAINAGSAPSATPPGYPSSGTQPPSKKLKAPAAGIVENLPSTCL